LAGYHDAAHRQEGLDGINEDSSIEDVAFSLSGLSAGDSSIAGQGYERLVTRWRKVQAFESAI